MKGQQAQTLMRPHQHQLTVWLSLSKPPVLSEVEGSLSKPLNLSEVTSLPKPPVRARGRRKPVEAACPERGTP
jgi:hypothetical protein